MNVGILLVKLAFVKLLGFLPLSFVRRFSRKTRKKMVVFILYEILAGSPVIMLAVGYNFGVQGTGSPNIESRLNMMVLIMYPFILFACPFLLLYFELKEAGKSPSIHRKSSIAPKPTKIEEKKTQILKK